MNDYIGKTCFVITPIGEHGTVIRSAAERVLEEAVVPTLKRLGFSVTLPHQIPSPGSIMNQVVQHLLDCDLVLANLTGLNPNVMYELAVRHAARKPVVSIAEEGTRLPFDIQAERTVLFSDRMGGDADLKEKLELVISAAMSQEQPDNPIYRVINYPLLSNSADHPTPIPYILQRLEELHETINGMRRSQPAVSPPPMRFIAYDEKTSRALKENLERWALPPSVRRVEVRALHKDQSLFTVTFVPWASMQQIEKDRKNLMIPIVTAGIVALLDELPGD